MIIVKITVINLFYIVYILKLSKLILFGIQFIVKILFNFFLYLHLDIVEVQLYVYSQIHKKQLNN